MRDTYILTPEAFRNAHPELASRAWVEDGHIAWTDRLTGEVNRIAIGVPICSACDQAECECFVEVERISPREIAA